MSPKRTTRTPARRKAVGLATQYRNTSTHRLRVMMENHSATLTSNSSPSSPSSTVSSDSASRDPSIIPAPSARTPVDIDSIHEFPMLPSGREEYLKRQGGTDELVKGLDTLHTASENIFKTQKEEIRSRMHQIRVLKEQCRKYQETICLSKLTQEREHRCPGCENLAWDPQILPSLCVLYLRLTRTYTRHILVKKVLSVWPACYFYQVEAPAPSTSKASHPRPLPIPVSFGQPVAFTRQGPLPSMSKASHPKPLHIPVPALVKKALPVWPAFYFYEAKAPVPSPSKASTRSTP
ncbi:hypothetical protein GG344DRAFT_75124 [Lentinula edodes]|nr:hypothetical protein GG344DRAFT_75124 [Lentinula edodes]